ncbi:28S ribosomal protein S5, mitochondrial [Galendromus occidentalis]|uniref:Small ribosomal subunit protein uS5m n=1 Tax=Galendromus occidentalis TaxID=34638 RepID=A0AAJ6QUZ4_9ACAR|nr:28S ribosomal protein S5, mitochondrial [Galendromus occidentalis]
MFRIASLTGQFCRMSLAPPIQVHLQNRSTSFFSKVTAEHLWKGVTSVSNAGRKRGRASGSSRKMARDLNRGQVLGVGKINMVWPGLSAPAIRGQEIIRQQKLEPDPEREKRLTALRNKHVGVRRTKIAPLDRGWSGGKAGGRYIGPPDPVGDENFEGFKSCVVKMGMVFVMRGNTGRTRQHKSIVIVGNGNGLIGFAQGKAGDARSALRKAKNGAAKNLVYIERFENHTVLHDFYTEYGSCKLIVKKKQRGYGLVCQRVVRELCKVIGIKDIFVKADARRMNTLSVIRAFLLGLHNQRSLQSVADEKRLHVVEFREEYGYFPKVVASPKDEPVRTAEEINPNEELDFNMIINGGRLVMMPKKKTPFYWNLPGYQIYLKKTDPLKNHRTTHLRILKRYGALKSFLTIREEEEQKQASLKSS